jgi:hypothetical protein
MGIEEILIIVMMVILYSALPIAAIVGVVLLYRKVSRIERILADHGWTGEERE